MIIGILQHARALWPQSSRNFGFCARQNPTTNTHFRHGFHAVPSERVCASVPERRHLPLILTLRTVNYVACVHKRCEVFFTDGLSGSFRQVTPSNLPA